MMKPFPHPINRHGARDKIILNEEQEAWFKEYFPIYSNEDIHKQMKVHLDFIRKHAKELGLEKSEEGMKQIKKRQYAKVARTWKRKYANDGRRPSEACIEGNKKRWEKVRNGELKGPYAICKERHPRKYAAMMKRKGRKLTKKYKMEKYRAMSGLRQETNLRIVVKPYTLRQTHHRCKALKLGYWYYEDNSE